MKFFRTTILLILLAITSVNAQESPGQYTHASRRLLTAEDVSTLSAFDLKVMRNEIFARYGYIFKSADLKKHFEAQSWYKPIKADVTNQLTEIEKKNIELIRSWEDRIAKTSDFESFFEIFRKAVELNDIEKLQSLVIYEIYKTPAEFENSYDIHAPELRKALESDYPTEGDTQANLRFGEFYQGVQYKWIEFQKIGCCWYIYAFRQAG